MLYYTLVFNILRAITRYVRMLHSIVLNANYKIQMTLINITYLIILCNILLKHIEVHVF